MEGLRCIKLVTQEENTEKLKGKATQIAED